MNNRLEYVLSGAAHCRITLASATIDPAATLIRNVVDKTTDMLQHHNITALYNAFTEVPNGRNMAAGKHFRTPMHADSGGLQIITRKMKADASIRQRVYEAQAKYAGVAMCFDEIPTTVNALASRRKFDPDLVKEKARATGNNILDQAKYFQKIGTDTKVFIVVQGNCMDTYNQWIEEIVKIIPEDLYPQIGGMSFAATSSGSGELQDIERIYSFANCPAPDQWKHKLHLLGVGSPTRMLPVLGFMHSGLLDDMLISYDSTTHSSSVTQRRYLSEACKFIECGEGNRERLFGLYNYCNDYFNILADFDTFADTFTYNRDAFITKNGEHNLHIFHEIMIASCMVSVFHLTRRLEEAMEKKSAYKKLCRERDCNSHQYLVEVKTKEDYDRYMKELGGFLSSSAVKREGEGSSLDSVLDDHYNEYSEKFAPADKAKKKVNGPKASLENFF
jgi:hypothetical protein